MKLREQFKALAKEAQPITGVQIKTVRSADGKERHNIMLDIEVPIDTLNSDIEINKIVGHEKFIISHKLLKRGDHLKLADVLNGQSDDSVKNTAGSIILVLHSDSTYGGIGYGFVPEDMLDIGEGVIIEPRKVVFIGDSVTRYVTKNEKQDTKKVEAKNSSDTDTIIGNFYDAITLAESMGFDKFFSRLAKIRPEFKKLVGNDLLSEIFNINISTDEAKPTDDSEVTTTVTSDNEQWVETERSADDDNCCLAGKRSDDMKVTNANSSTDDNYREWYHHWSSTMDADGNGTATEVKGDGTSKEKLDYLIRNGKYFDSKGNEVEFGNKALRDPFGLAKLIERLH